MNYMFALTPFALQVPWELYGAAQVDPAYVVRWHHSSGNSDFKNSI